MRPIRLARIAAEAEGVRLRGMATRIVTRLVFAVVALVFLLGVLVFAHIAAWYAIRMQAGLTYLETAGALGGVDLLLAAILGFLASRSRPSRVEIEAKEVRRKAIEGIGNAFSLAQMALPVLRLVPAMRRRKRGR